MSLPCSLACFSESQLAVIQQTVDEWHLWASEDLMLFSLSTSAGAVEVLFRAFRIAHLRFHGVAPKASLPIPIYANYKQPDLM
jgi:hypothetical protein